MRRGSAPAVAASPPGPRRWRRRLGRLLGAVLLLLGLKTVWFFHCRVDGAQSLRGQDRAELLARRDYLLSRVTAPHFGPHELPALLGSQFQGEWALVTLSMTALSLGGLAQQYPDTAGPTEVALDKIIDRALSSDLSAFDTERWNEPALATLGSDHGHIGYLGHLTLILAVREHLFPGSPHRRFLGQLTAALLRKLTHSPCGLAPTYPGELYVPDNAVVLAALALAARAGSAPAAAAELWPKLRARYADPSSGFLPFRLSASCQVIDPDRASGAAWNLLYLGLVDREYLRKGHASLQERFLDRPLPGLWGLREWPRGTDRAGDIDSGPLPLGLSPAATGFAVAAARRLGDADVLQRLLDTAELVGSTIEIGGRRRYLLAPIVGDAILLAARAPLRL